MKLDELIERTAIRGLIVTDDEKCVYVGYTFDPKTVILSLDRVFFEQAQARLILSMVDDRLEYTDTAIDLAPHIRTALTVTSNHSTHTWGEITPGYSAPPAPGQYQKLRNAAGFLLRKSREGLTKIVHCSILLLFLCGIAVVAIKKRRKKNAATITG